MISCCVAFFASPKSNSQNQSRPPTLGQSIHKVTISASLCRTSNSSKSKLPHILVRGQTHHQGSSNNHGGSATELGKGAWPRGR